MRGLVQKLIGVLAFAVVLLMGSLTWAGYIYNLSSSLGSGSIELDALTGTSSVDASAFSFHVSVGAGSPQDYGLDDIASISWTIDNSSFELTNFLLKSNFVPFGAFGESAILLNLGGAAVFDTCFIAVAFDAMISCVVKGDSREGSVDVLAATFTGASVPEPGTLALLGLAGLTVGYTLRRRKR